MEKTPFAVAPCLKTGNSHRKETLVDEGIL